MTQATSPSEDETIRRALTEAARIATLPQVATKAIEMVEDPDADHGELARLMEADPVLSAKLLKVANSPMYGFAQKVSSVRRATDLLGIVAVRNVTVAVSMAKLFQPGPIVAGVDARVLWTHSNAVAIASRQVARHVGEPIDEAYLAGLLHEIGVVLEMLVDRPSLAAAMTDRPEGFVASERGHFGTDHQRLGEALCRSWRLPDVVCEAVAHHHDPDPPSRLAAVVYLANALAPAGFGLDVETEVPPTVMTKLGFGGGTDLDRLREVIAYEGTAAPWEK